MAEVDEKPQIPYPAPDIVLAEIRNRKQQADPTATWPRHCSIAGSFGPGSDGQRCKASELSRHVAVADLLSPTQPRAPHLGQIERVDHANTVTRVNEIIKTRTA
jgi:hypothetical protein